MDIPSHVFPLRRIFIVVHRPRHPVQKTSKKRWWPSPSQRGPPPIQGGPLRKGQWKADYQPSRLARENGATQLSLAGKEKTLPQTSNLEAKISPLKISENSYCSKAQNFWWAIWKCLLVSGRAFDTRSLIESNQKTWVAWFLLIVLPFGWTRTFFKNLLQ